ncbi:hypothetical protein VULLAG_LOCUS3082 [Vulpes lagopus]
MRFAKKHNKKGLKKMQASNAKAMTVRAEAIEALVKPKEVKPKILKGGSRKLNRLAYIAHPKLRNVLEPALPKVSGSAGQSPRPRLKPRPRLQLWPWLWLLLLLLQRRPPKVPRPPQRLQCRVFCLPV